MTEEIVRNCIKNGARKINFGAELNAVYSNALQQYFGRQVDVSSPVYYSQCGRNAVYDQVKARIQVCQCENLISAD